MSPALTVLQDRPDLTVEQHFMLESAVRYLEILGEDAAELAAGDPLAVPLGFDARGVLVGAGQGPAPTVDVVVCVHNALEDVRRCLSSLVAKTDRPFRLIVVDDGSDAPTSAHLRRFQQANPAVTLIANPDPPHGYTVAANLGMEASTGDFVVLLNSDTMVTPGWIERLLEAAEAAPEVGILGPLSNAATLQSVPHVRADGAWANNPLPAHLTPDAMATLVKALSDHALPRFPFINGFCYVIRRTVLDAIGRFDEENFQSGYCEENDFSQRARDAGFELAIVDDAYVFHAQSKSYTSEGRSKRARRHYEIFLEKHGREKIGELVRRQESDETLDPLRARLDEVLTNPVAAARTMFGARTGEPLSLLFVLDAITLGGSGGSHVLDQEVAALQALGVDAWIAVEAEAWDSVAQTYPGAAERWVAYGGEEDLRELAASTDVVVATHHFTVPLVGAITAGSRTLPAYYVQDYEPFFFSGARQPEEVDRARASYTELDGALILVKTHWIENVLARAHGVEAEKIEPSIDLERFGPAGRLPATADGPVTVAAMIRPSTPRRRAEGTVSVLAEVRRRLGDRVRVRSFGCDAEALAELPYGDELLDCHEGALTRGEVADVLRASDVFVDLSTFQALGLTALEAMACGATCVLPRIGGTAEYGAHERNALYCDSYDEASAVAAVVRLVEDDDLRARLQADATRTGAGYPTARAALSLYLAVERAWHRRFDGA